MSKYPSKLSVKTHTILKALKNAVPEKDDKYISQAEIYEIQRYLSEHLADPEQDLPNPEEIPESKSQTILDALDFDNSVTPEHKQSAWEQILTPESDSGSTASVQIPDEIKAKAKAFAEKKINPQLIQTIAPKISQLSQKGALTKVGTLLSSKLGLSSLGAITSGGTSLLLQAGMLLIDKARNLFRGLFIKFIGNNDGSNLATASIGAAAIGLLFPPAMVLAVFTGGLAYVMGGGESFRKATKKMSLFALALMMAVISVVLTPIIIAMIVLPILTAFVILVITNSSYLVPPAEGGVYVATGPGGAYPQCWPATGVIVQRPHCLGTNIYTHCSSYNSWGLGNAIDISGPMGTPIYAAHDGVATGDQADAYGNRIVVTSPLGFATIYAHLTSILPQFAGGGQEVKAGDLVGFMGISGTDNVHLHYELRGLGLLDNYVPAYNEGGPTNGCFASEAGGSQDIENEE